MRIASTTRRTMGRLFFYAFLCLYALSIVYPIFLMLVTAFKTTAEIFRNPFGLPGSPAVENFSRLFTASNYGRYFLNSLLVTVVSLLAIIAFSSHVSFTIARYRFRFKNLLYMFFVIGLIIPIKLGTISLLRIMIGLALYDTPWSLVCVNTALGIPFAVFILVDFIRMIPEELSNAARIDGCSEPRIFYSVYVPLLRPGLTAAALVNLIPIWNDFWFPLIFIKSDGMKTVPLATALLFGQFQTNFGFVFAVLTTASVPVMLLYLLLSRQFGKSLTFGAIKG